ncbi:MAG: type II toxin-antitoxin system VapC family toxin [Salinisphaera sp.]|jgi:tRNA(fMet)-specific endonuclease VapC|nr:type II toxin-antitoxin system VapC family toxin [Salinisphaera sp.]
MAHHGFLLDTNILSNVIKRPSGPAAQKIAEVGPAVCSTSVIVACELRYGAAKKAAPQLTEKVNALLQQLVVLPLDGAIDEHYAKLRCELETQGQTIGANDQLIAAHALALDLTLVTHNTGEFCRVPNLRVENWLG